MVLAKPRIALGGGRPIKKLQKSAIGKSEATSFVEKSLSGIFLVKEAGYSLSLGSVPEKIYANVKMSRYCSDCRLSRRVQLFCKLSTSIVLKSGQENCCSLCVGQKSPRKVTVIVQKKTVPQVHQYPREVFVHQDLTHNYV